MGYCALSLRETQPHRTVGMNLINTVIKEDTLQKYTQYDPFLKNMK